MIYKVGDLVDLLGFSVSHMRKLVREGNFKGAYKNNNEWFIPEEGYNQYLVNKKLNGIIPLKDCVKHIEVPEDFIKLLIKNKTVKGIKLNDKYFTYKTEYSKIKKLYFDTKLDIPEDKNTGLFLFSLIITLWTLILFYFLGF